MESQDKPITWREFRNVTIGDLKEGDLALLDPVCGVCHVTKVEDLFIAGEVGWQCEVRRLTVENRSLAFPHLASDLEHFEEQRFWAATITRGKHEPVLVVHVVHPRNPHSGSLPS